jgi:hypothetical protein
VARVDDPICRLGVSRTVSHGELNDRTVLNQSTVIQILMQATNGLGVILENRFHSNSYPFNSSTTDEIAYLTTEQSRSDCVDRL